MSSIRSKIIETAIAEAMPFPYGKVSDCVRDASGKRAGWESLKNYFDDAILGWTEAHWAERGEILVNGENKEIVYLQGVQVPNYRVPQGKTKPSGVSWCGIFATWVLRKAGLHDTQWVVGAGIRGSKVRTVMDTKGFNVGDVIVINGAEVHHAIVAEMPDYYLGDTSMKTINGNSGAQSIEVHRKYSAKQVGYYYQIVD